MLPVLPSGGPDVRKALDGRSVTIEVGGMAEWLKAAVLKTVSGVTRSGVRIPLPPPALYRLWRKRPEKGNPQHAVKIPQLQGLDSSSGKLVSDTSGDGVDQLN